jgi:hypothetical protein
MEQEATDMYRQEEEEEEEVKNTPALLSTDAQHSPTPTRRLQDRWLAT